MEPEFIDGGTGVLRNVSCASATECVAIGPNGQGAGDSTASAFAVTTTNGGEKWTSSTMPPSSYTLNAVSCAPDGSCVASGPGPGTSAPEATSTDGGVTWQDTTSLPASVSAVAKISCLSSTSCVFVGLEGPTAVTGTTTDGSTWSVQPVTTIDTTTSTTQTGVAQ